MFKHFSFSLQYISDIHLERRSSFPLIKPRSNYLALLGDIGHPRKPLYNDFLKYCSINWNKVFLISGNHEHYDSGLSTDSDINNIVSKYNNVYYLNNSKINVDNYLILGTTLWYKPLEKDRNYQIINKKHDDSLEFLHHNLDFSSAKIDREDQDPPLNLNSSNKNVIVLSHHLPSYKLIIPKYHTPFYKPLQYRYATNLEYMIKPPVKAWLCGHSHSQVEMTIPVASRPPRLGVYCGINTFKEEL